HGRVRAMVSDLGERVKEAGPSTPVEITGLNGVPEAGDQFLVFKDEKFARQIGEARQKRHLIASRGPQNKISLEDLLHQIKQGENKYSNLIIKADVQGSAEAHAETLQKIKVDTVQIKIIHKRVGAINESDIQLASASNALVISLIVRTSLNAEKTAEIEHVDVRLQCVIYKANENMEATMKGRIKREHE